MVTGLITQNVDLLHEAAGSRHVIDLHGRYDRVRCLSCGTVDLPRGAGRPARRRSTPGSRRRVADIEIAPDADAVIEQTSHFVVAGLQRLRRDAQAGHRLLRRERAA